jgi:hypothetical protein
MSSETHWKSLPISLARAAEQIMLTATNAIALAQRFIIMEQYTSFNKTLKDFYWCTVLTNNQVGCNELGNTFIQLIQTAMKSSILSPVYE